MVVRELLAKLGVQVDDSKLKAFDENVKGLKDTFKGLALGAGVAAAAIGGMIARSAAYGNQVEDESAKLNVTRKGYQELAYTQRQTGVAVTTLIGGLKSLNDQVRAARMGNSYAGYSFSRLGVSLTDSSGKAKTTRQVFYEVATALSKMEPSYLKAQRAQALFGGGAMELMPALNHGGESLRQYAADAEKLGLVLTPEQTIEARNLAGEIAALGAAFDGLSITLGADFVPMAKSAVLAINEWYKANSKLIQGELRRWLTGLIEGGKQAAVSLSALGERIGRIVARAGGVGAVMRALRDLFLFFMAAKVAGALISLITLVGQLQAVLVTAGISSAAAWGWALAIPAAAAAALLLAMKGVQDVTAYMAGEKGTFTESIVAWFEDQSLAETAKQWWADIGGGAVELYRVVTEWGGKLLAWLKGWASSIADLVPLRWIESLGAMIGKTDFGKGAVAWSNDLQGEDPFAGVRRDYGKVRGVAALPDLPKGASVALDRSPIAAANVAAREAARAAVTGPNKSLKVDRLEVTVPERAGESPLETGRRVAEGAMLGLQDELRGASELAYGSP